MVWAPLKVWFPELESDLLQLSLHRKESLSTFPWLASFYNNCSLYVMRYSIRNKAGLGKGSKCSLASILDCHTYSIRLCYKFKRTTFRTSVSIIFNYSIAIMINFNWTKLLCTCIAGPASA